MVRYICLMEDGSIKITKKIPDNNQSSHMHGFMLLSPTPENTKVLSRAAEYCDKGIDYETS